MQDGRGYETGLLAGVIVLDVFLWESFVYCPLKVNTVASHVVTLSELHRIFPYIWGNYYILVLVYIQGFQYIFCMEQGVDNCSCYPLIHVCKTI